MVHLKGMHFMLLKYISIEHKINVISDITELIHDSLLSHLCVLLLESEIHVTRCKWYSALSDPFHGTVPS